MTTCRGSVARPLGLALTTAGRFDEADDAFAQAAAAHARIDALVEAAAGIAVRLGLPTISRQAEALLS